MKTRYTLITTLSNLYKHDLFLLKNETVLCTLIVSYLFRFVKSRTPNSLILNNIN